MELQRTAPDCMVQGCDNVAALKDIAASALLVFTTWYCSDCYEMLRDGKDVLIDPARIQIEHRAARA